MGNVSSVPLDPTSSLYLRRPDRFAVTGMEVYASPVATGSAVSMPGKTLHMDSKPILQVNEALNVSTFDDRPAEFIKEPDSQCFPFVLKVPYHQTLVFKFRLAVKMSQATAKMNNLTFISANSRRQLDNFITNEFFHNPNIQNEDNVALLGDYSEDCELEFMWDWSSTNAASKGTPLVLCFAEYDKREHSLQQLGRFSVFIEASSTPETPTLSYSPNVAAPLIPSPSPPPPPINTSYPSHGQIVSPSSVNPHLASPNRAPSVTLPPPSSPILGSSAPSQQPQQPQPQQQQPQQQPQPQLQQASLEPQESIDVVLQREKQGAAIPRPDGDSTSQPEDGPLFRATISSLEKRTGNLKLKTKKLLKRAMLVHERQQALVEALRLFNQSLRDVGQTDMPAFQSIIYKYFDRQDHHGQLDLINYLKESSHEMHNHVVEPLRKLYELEIKSFDVRKREFDDESNQYYSWLSRYLSMKQEAKGKKKVESDSKYLEKRKAFELCRFDYYSYMQDLHGGRKQQDVTFQLALYAEGEVNRLIQTADDFSTKVKPQLDTVVSEVKDANKDWSRQRTEREVRRRALERSVGSPDGASPVVDKDDLYGQQDSTQQQQQQQQQQQVSITSLPSSNMDSDAKNNNTNNNNIAAPQPQLPPQLKLNTEVSSAQGPETAATLQTPMEETTYERPVVEDGLKKEGLLWAMSRPGGLSEPIANLNKAGWHKFWVVLAAGKICEYTNWKQGVVDLHNEPINLKVACVREARNADRRFCFEVVTPNYKRVYQATNEEDMQAWIRAVNNGITSSLENFDEQYPVQRRASSRRAPSLGHGHHHHHHHHNYNTQYNQQPNQPPAQATPAPDDAMLQKVRALSPGNFQCADCGSTNKCEWMSINLLVVLCIDCSGVHRSLGSHISKVRSLTLDTVSFTDNVVELIKLVNNEQLNGIWERTLESKPQVNADNRAAFITEKYVEKKFIEPIPRPNAALRTAVTNNDILGAIHALASRANPNTLSGEEKDVDESLLLYSLRIAPTDAVVFPMSELLLLNSATLPSSVPANLNGDNAKVYLSKKLAKENCNNNAPAPPPPPPTMVSNAPLPQSDQQPPSRSHSSKLPKRLSVGLNAKATSSSGTDTTSASSSASNVVSSSNAPSHIVNSTSHHH